MTWTIGTPVFSEKFGKGRVAKINPYWDGTKEYASNTHYKIFFSKTKLFVTLFERELIKRETNETD